MELFEQFETGAENCGGGEKVEKTKEVETAKCCRKGAARILGNKRNHPGDRMGVRVRAISRPARIADLNSTFSRRSISPKKKKKGQDPNIGFCTYQV